MMLIVAIVVVCAPGVVAPSWSSSSPASVDTGVVAIVESLMAQRGPGSPLTSSPCLGIGVMGWRRWRPRVISWPIVVSNFSFPAISSFLHGSSISIAYSILLVVVVAALFTGFVVFLHDL